MTQFHFTKTIKFATVAVAATMISASAASAASLNLEVGGATVGSFESVSVTLPGYSGLAGAFEMNDTDAMSSFTVFCLDLLSTVKDSSYDIVDPPFSVGTFLAGAQDRIQQIFDSGYQDALVDQVSSAGFQVALWNAVYDADWSVSADAGDFYQEDGNDAVRNSANGFLQAADGFVITNTYSLSFLEGSLDEARTQNLVTADLTPVPLPASGLLLVAAMGGLMAARRRKSA